MLRLAFFSSYLPRSAQSGIHTTKLYHYVFYGFSFLVSAITVSLLMMMQVLQ